MRESFSIRMIEGVFLAIPITAIAAAVFAQDQGKTSLKSVPAARVDASDGRAMFKSYCASCHGVDAKGNGPAVPALKKAPGDLTLLTKMSGGKFPELRVYNSIAGDISLPAHGSAEMPIWGNVFRGLGPSDTDAKLRVRNLTKYLESIQVK